MNILMDFFSLISFCFVKKLGDIKSRGRIITLIASPGAEGGIDQNGDTEVGTREFIQDLVISWSK